MPVPHIKEEHDGDEAHKAHLNMKKSSENHENASKSLMGPDLYAEVGELALYLNKMVTKVRTAGSIMESVSSELHIGRDELQDVHRKTEEATTKILDDADKIVENHSLMSERIEDIQTALNHESPIEKENLEANLKHLTQLLDENKLTMMNLVGTLSFQDPAGQQLRKVNAMLKVFQSRLLKMVVTFGQNNPESDPGPEHKEALLSELEYSASGEKLDQQLVDRVLKEYGF